MFRFNRKPVAQPLVGFALQGASGSPAYFVSDIFPDDAPAVIDLFSEEN